MQLNWKQNFTQLTAETEFGTFHAAITYASLTKDNGDTTIWTVPCDSIEEGKMLCEGKCLELLNKK